MKKTNDIRNLTILGIGVFLFIWCLSRFFMIPPGYVGVIVNLFGEEKGVSSKELSVGMHWIAPWKRLYKFPTFEQNFTWEGAKHAFDFQTSEGMACTAEIGITYHLRIGDIHTIFQKYRRGMGEITDVFIRNYVRDAINKAASKIRIEDLYGQDKDMFFDNVQSMVRNDLHTIGIEVSRIYLIGRFHFPPNVIAALNSKIEAVQRAQQRENELRESEAQAKKVIAAAQGEAEAHLLKARAEAIANKVVASSLTKELVEYTALQKWNGELPTVMGDGILPMITLPHKDSKK